MNRRRLMGSVAAAALSFGVGSVVAAGPALAAGTDWWVDGASATCSNTGTGTQTTPLCTITAAANKATAAGDVVHVLPASYAEQVTVAGSGLSGAPITFRAEGTGVVVVGTRDVTGNVWTAGSNGTWSTPYTSPNTAPVQAFRDGARLTKGSGASSLTSGQWFYDTTAKVLYANVGGDSPVANGHTVTAGAQTYGFNVNGRSNVVITGFGTVGQNVAGVHVGTASSAVTVDSLSSDLSGSNGVLLDGSSTGVTVSGSTVLRSGSNGIKLTSVTSSTISGNTVRASGLHGISLSGSSGNTIQRNESADNVVTSGANASAAGIDVNATSPNTTVIGNLTHGNQDSGIQIYNGSNNALVARNVSFANGNHGFDTLASTGARYVSNTAYANHDDGFSIEGASTGATLRDNIAVDNGLATAGADLYVQGNSTTGLSADSDIFWNSTWVPAIQIDLARYRTVADYRTGTGQEAHGLGQDPNFVDAASGNLALSANSPAIDSADASASGFQANDKAGQAPADDPAVPDTGLGTPAYADRGALERVPQSGDPTATAPHAALVLSATSGAVPPAVPVTADATGSSDPDGQGIASYTFDFGDGTVVGPQAAGSAQHSYITSGSFTVTVTVRDAGGLQGAAQQAVVLTVRGTLTYRVDNRDASCSDAADGVTTPFCTISRAAVVALAGDTVVVNPGDYLEQVTPAHTGMSSAPLTFRANGSGVRVVGTTDLSGATWTSTSTSAWSASVAAASPIAQVLLDGARLAAATSATTTTSGSFFYDSAAGRLYVDTGGSNPSVGHTVLASTRTYGFKLWNADSVVVDGFTTWGQNGIGVSLQDSTGITVVGVTAQAASSHGISSDRSSGVTVSGSTSVGNGAIGIRMASSNGATISGNTTTANGFHGISVQSSSNVTISGNTASANSSPTQRIAAGIDVSLGSTGAVVERNTTFGNQDSGIEIYTASNNATVRRNVSYDNGDHCLDCLRSTGDAVVGNTVVGNSAAGINLEGGCSGSTVADNVSADNAVNSTRTIGDIRLDEASSPGSSVRSNLLSVPAGGPLYEWNSAPYTTVAAFQAASGTGTGDLSGDPQFTNAAARDLSLSVHSPAVDSADLGVSGAAANDRDGVAPTDVAAVPDTGAGNPAYADRGALEYHGTQTSAAGPTAAVSATPSSGFAPLTVTASASGSTAGDSAIASYTFTCGNGTTVGPQAGSSAACSYPSAGTFTLGVRVVDAAGFWSVASTTVTVSPPAAAPVARLTATPTTGVAPLAVTLDASQSTDPQGQAMTYAFNCGNGTSFAAGTSTTRACTYAAGGTFTASVTVADALGLSSTATTTVSVTANQAPKAVLKLTTAPGTVAPTTATFDATGSTDPEGGALTYTFNCGNGTSVGPQASPTVTCSYTSGGTFNAKVTVTDPVGLTGSSPNIKLVIGSNQAPSASMTVSLSSTRIPATATINASASRDPEGGPLTYRFDCGNGTVVGPQTSSGATCTYTKTGKYTIRLTVTDNTGQTGSATYSFRL